MYNRRKRECAGVGLADSNTDDPTTLQSQAVSGPPYEDSLNASIQQRSRKRQKQEQNTAGTSFPPEVVLLCAQRLSPNEVSCTLRAVCCSARDTLAPDPRHCTAHLSQPLPPHVATWSPAALHGAVTALQQLSFVRKLCLPALAATSGCTTNLEVAWRLVSPCLCPQLPLRLYTSQLPERADAGVAAARMGLSDLVVWLAERRCPLVPARVARAAAVHCSLAGLREAWGALLRLDPGLGAEAVACWREVTKVADGEAAAAAREVGSGGGGMPCMDVQDKGAWLYEQHQRHQQQQQQEQQEQQQQQPEGHMADGVQQQPAAAAALPAPAHVPPEWLWSRRTGGLAGDVAAHNGPRCSCCAPPGQELAPYPNGLTTFARLSHAAWEGDVERVRDMLLQLGELEQQGQAEAEAAGQQQGGPQQGQQQADPQQAEGPQPPPQQQQQGGVGVPLREARSVLAMALRSGSIVAARTMHQAGYRPSEDCYYGAASSGQLHCLRWLLLEARPCPFGRYGGTCASLLAYWPVASNAEQEREELEVLRLLIAAGCPGPSNTLWPVAARRGSLPLLLEALRVEPTDQRVVNGGGGGGSGGNGGGGSGGGSGGRGPQPCMPASLLPALAAGGCEAALELYVRCLGTPVRSVFPGFCCRAWAEAAGHGDMATLECLRRLGVPWDSDGFGRELRARVSSAYKFEKPAPLTVPVLRWAVEGAGCWELGAGACRQLAGCLEDSVQQAKEAVVGDEGEGGRRGRRPGWKEGEQDVEAVVAWLKERAERLDREDELAH